MTNFTPQSIKSALLPTWCPGCGNYAILASLHQAILQLQIPMEELVIVYGIGCSGNMADFNASYGFHGLHGRAVANALGIKLANHKLKVIVIAGEGDTYGEGLNHLLAAARGNHQITVIIHNNQAYSLTTGQTSPTTPKGVRTKTTPGGAIEQPLNPLSLLLDSGATFVARGYAAKAMMLLNLIKQAINHPGFALIDVLQPCPTFNKVHSYAWYQQHTQDLPADYDVSNLELAWQIAQNQDIMSLGLLYQNDQLPAYHQQLPQLQTTSLINQFQPEIDLTAAMSLMK